MDGMADTKKTKEPNMQGDEARRRKGADALSDARTAGGAEGSDEVRKNDPAHQRARCVSDIEQFYSNVKEVKRTAENAHILDLAAQYCEDTKFFLEKEDYVTAFGAINYAHGLIDAFRKAKEED